MKRSLIYLLIATVAAGWLGTLIARDPGYVLVSYHGAYLQTGLWVMLAMLLLFVVAIYYLLRLFGVVRATTGNWRSWWGGRARSRSEELTATGLTCFQEGDFERAERFLRTGADHATNPAVNYVYAARAADAQGKAEDRENYLRKAVEADGAARLAVAVAGAEMAVARGEFQRALSCIEGVKENETVLNVRAEAMLGLKDWQGVSDLMPQLRKTAKNKQSLIDLQRRIAIERLSAEGVTDEDRTAVFRKLSEEMKRDPEVVGTYCRHLESEKDAEAAIRAALKREWNAALLERYGSLGQETLARRVKAAEGWLKEHGDDAALHLCLGLLYEADGNKERAKAAYQKSIDLKNSPAASRGLGRLLAFDGDYRKSSEYLNLALKLASE